MSGRGKVSTRGRGARRTATTAANRGPINPGETRISPPKGKSKKTASPLPPQYSFTPAEASTSVTPRSCVPVFSEGVKDFPPPPQLLTSRSQPGSGNSGTDPRASASPRPSASASEARPSASLQPRPSASLQPPPAATQARSAPSPQAPPAASPQAQSSEAQNDHLEEDEEEYDEDYEEVDFDGDEGLQPHLAEDVLDALTNLLIQPGRDQYTTLLSPTLEPGTVWFIGKDKSALTRKITRIFTNKFDQPYYNWGCVPVPKKEKYFLEFAKEHTWHPIHTGLVQSKFEKICQVRLKDMVSKAGTKRKQPKWIGNTLWGKMCDYWITEEAKAKHDTTSAARMSDRNGQGIHKHVSGQKSFLQVEQELEVTLGRPPTVAEVFVKTHTKKDGSFVDQRAQEVFDLYKQKKEAKLAELEHENDESADGTSPRSQLSLEEDNEVFYKSTVTNDRGQMYGLGSLGTYINGKRKYPGSSSSFTTVNQQLEDANRKIEEITALQAQREAEHLRVTSALQAEVKGLGVVKKYLSIKDPDFLAFLTDEEDPSNSPL